MKEQPNITLLPYLVFPVTESNMVLAYSKQKCARSSCVEITFYHHNCYLSRDPIG